MDEKYIDANIFVEAALRNDINSINILKKIMSKEIKASTSILSWDELVYIVKKFNEHKVAVEEGERFLIFPNLNFIDAKKDIISRSQKLIEKYNIKPRDAIHSATALSLNIKEIISADRDFDKVLELKRIDPSKI